MNKEHYGAYIRRRRKLRNISLLTFGKLIGKSDAYISKIETGSTSKVPCEEVITKIANVLSLDTNDLMMRTGQLPKRIMDILLEHPIETLKFIRGLENGKKN